MRWLLLSLLLFAAQADAAYSPDTVGTTDSNATLRNIPTTAVKSVSRLGFATPGDAPPQLYRPQTGTCAASGWANDGGSCVDTASGGNSWLAVWGESGLDLAQWGGTPTATATVNDNALDAAFAWVCKAKSTVRIAHPRQAQVYAIARAHVLGNGSATVNSTCNNVSVVMEPDNLENAAGQTNAFYWTGPTGSTPVFTFKGPMAGVKVEGLSVDCAAICTTGIRVNNTINSQFLRLSVTRNINGPGIILDAEPVNVWAGALEGSYFRTIITTASGLGGSGVQIGNTTASTCTLGVGWDKIDDLNVSWDSSTAGTYGVALGGATQLTVAHGRIFPYNAAANTPTDAGLGNSLVIKPPPCDPSTPSNIVFDHVQFGKAPRDPYADGVTWNPAGGAGIQFRSYDQTYAASRPISHGFGYFYGDTSTGAIFPGRTDWAPALKFGGANAGMVGTAVGSLFKQGPLYHAEFKVTLSAKGTSTGAATVSGFPFTQNSTSNTTGTVVHFFGSSAPNNVMQSIIGPSTTDIGIYTQGAAATDTAFGNTSIMAGAIDILTDPGPFGFKRDTPARSKLISAFIEAHNCRFVTYSTTVAADENPVPETCVIKAESP